MYVLFILFLICNIVNNQLNEIESNIYTSATCLSQGCETKNVVTLKPDFNNNKSIKCWLYRSISLNKNETNKKKIKMLHLRLETLFCSKTVKYSFKR